MRKVAFVCVGNAGRSQMATAFAERERGRRDLDVEIVTGGVDPADHVHEDVIEVLDEEGLDVGDRTPRKIEPGDVADATHIVTMGCSVEDFAPDDWGGKTETWEISHPEGDDLDPIREQRAEIEGLVEEFFDRLEG